MRQTQLTHRSQCQHAGAAEEGCLHLHVRQQHRQHDRVERDAEDIVYGGPRYLGHTLALKGTHEGKVHTHAHLEQQKPGHYDHGVGGKKHGR